MISSFFLGQRNWTFMESPPTTSAEQSIRSMTRSGTAGTCQLPRPEVAPSTGLAHFAARLDVLDRLFGKVFYSDQFVVGGRAPNQLVELRLVGGAAGVWGV